MKTDALDALIQEAMLEITEGESPLLRVLRNQYESCVDVRINLDGYGFYAYMMPDPRLRIKDKEKQAFEVSDLVGFNEDGQCSVGFVLFVRDGLIFMLEGFPFLENSWPSEDIGFKYVAQPPMSNAVYSDERHFDDSKPDFQGEAEE